MALSERCMDVGVLWPNQMVRWIKMKPGTQVGLSPGHIVLDEDWGPSSPPLKELSPTPNFWPISVVAIGWIKMPLGVQVGLGPGDFVLDRNPVPPPQKGKVWKKTDTFNDRTGHWCYKAFTHVLWKENNCICVQCCQLVTLVVRNNVGHNFKRCNLMVKTVLYFSNARKFSGKFPEKYFSGKITSLVQYTVHYQWHIWSHWDQGIIDIEERHHCNIYVKMGLRFPIVV